jgi:hypothetical protein
MESYLYKIELDFEVNELIVPTKIGAWCKRCVHCTRNDVKQQ